MAITKIAIFVSLAVITHSVPIQTPTEGPQNAENPNVVPGVFISADALKDLQAQAKQKLSEDEKSRNQNNELKSNSETQEVTPNSLMVQGNQSPFNQQPFQYQQQPPIQQQMLPNQGPVYQQQPQYLNQQPEYNNQQPIYQQPYQPVVNNPPMQLINNQPQPIYTNQPQYPIGQQQAMVPNQQQPIYQQPIANQPTLIYPNGQQPQLVYPNVQQNIGNQQPTLYQNGQALMPQNQQPVLNQPTLIYPINQVPNQQGLPQNPAGNLYTLVPVNNGLNSVPNPNLGGGSYLVQQAPNQGPVYTLNNGK